MHRGKSAGSGKCGGEAAEAWDAGHYRCRRWKMLGLRISSAKLQGKTRDGGKDGSGALPLQAPLPSILQGSVWGSLGKGSFPRGREEGRTALTAGCDELSSPTLSRSSLAPGPLSGGRALSWPLGDPERAPLSWSVRMLPKKSLLDR